MRIAQVCPYSLAVPGGVQTHVIELATTLRRRDHEVVIVAPGADGVDGAVSVGSSARIRANGAVAPIAVNPLALGRTRRALVGFDVVHVHEPAMPFVGWGGLGADRLVVTFHADPSPMVRRACRLPGVRRLFGSAMAATVVSEVAASAVAHLFETLVRIPNGLHVASYRQEVHRQPHQVAFLGRPDPRKGRDLILAAWPDVRRQVNDATLVVVGADPGVDGEGIVYAGQVDEVQKRRILSASSIFCAPNRGGESFGITVAEGMAAGCAVVASDIPAFVELLDGTGVHFRNGDVAELAARLVGLLSDAPERSSKAASSRRRVERFDWDSLVNAYLEVYRSTS